MSHFAFPYLVFSDILSLLTFPPPLKNALKEQLAMKMATHVLTLALSMNLMVFLFLARVSDMLLFNVSKFQTIKRA